jgi:hypothetical protein
MNKNFLLATLLMGCLYFTKAQTTENAPELNCFNKWATKFEERGAEDVADGVYTDVIITSRMGSKANCYSGKVEVKDKKILRCYIVLDDGSYEEVKRTWKNESDKNVAIINGMSSSMITVHNELVNVLWPKKIKAKRAAPKHAPDPTDD